jgi:hypothetical protein
VTAGYAAAAAATTALPTFGLSVPVLGVVAATATVVAVGAGVVGIVASFLQDPADRNFKSLFHPVFAKVRAIAVPASLSSVGRLLTTYLQNQERLLVLATAFRTSVDRATGARDAHDAVWVGRQQRAAAKWASRAAKLLLGFEAERDAIAKALTAARVQMTVSASQESEASSSTPTGDIATTLRDVAAGGILPALKAKLVDDSGLRKTLDGGAPPAGFSFPADLPSPALAAVEAKVASALEGYAATYGYQTTS